MYANKFQNLNLSALGMGCMRLPELGGYSEVNLPAVKQMVAYAMEQGTKISEMMADFAEKLK